MVGKAAKQSLKVSWEILPKVSRSFSFCISVLPQPLDEQMMVAYLVFRVIDTIEDSHAPLSRKKELFTQFMSLFSGKRPETRTVMESRDSLLSSLDYTYEKDLLESIGHLVGAFYSLPAGARKPILKWGKVMSKGMYEYQNKRIETFEDQDRYSYYVAGVIGYLFDDLLYFNGIVSSSLKRRLHRYAKDFGLALQKVNILRDIAADAVSKRYYWPASLLAKYGLSYDTLCLAQNRQKALAAMREQIADAHKYLDSAMKYVLLLPEKALKVRRFCLIPLFMAIESYVKCFDNPDVFDPNARVKISRLSVQLIIARSALIGCRNSELQKWFCESMRPVPAMA